MTGHRFLLLVAAVSLLVAAPVAQQRPDFSGRWVQESPAEGAGQEQVIKHDATTLSTEHGSESGSHRAVYRLDGTTSRNAIGSHGSEIVTESQASWKDDRLTITSTTTYPDGRRRLATEVWSLDAAGKLVIEFKETIDGKSTADVKLVFVKRTDVAPAPEPRIGEAAAQRRPNFAGTWTLIHEPGEPQRAGTFGDTFVANQYPQSLVLDWKSLQPGGRGAAGKMVERQAHAAYIFDGTPSNVTDIHTTTSRGSRAQIFDTTRWDGQRLVVTTTRRGFSPPRVTRTQILWLDSDGALIVETNRPPDGGSGAWTTVRSRYRRTGD